LKKKRGEIQAVASSMLFFLNPIALYNSAIWGQMDSITTGMFLLSFYFLYKKHFTLALTTAIFSLFVKVSLVFLLPVIIVSLYDLSKSLTDTLKSIAVAFALMLLAILPVSLSPFVWLFGYISQNLTGEMQNITAFAFNLWWFLFTPVLSIVSTKTVFDFSEIRLFGSPLVSQTFLGIPLWIYAVSIFLLSLFPFVKIWMNRREKFLEPRKLFLFSSLMSLMVFLILPQMHERYMYPVFPFLAIAIGFGEPFLFEFLSLSVLHLLNLIFVWHPMKELLPLYPLMNSPFIQWGISALIVCVSLSMYWKSYYRLKSL
jgi:Gpi18-like mannosyltransferase